MEEKRKIKEIYKCVAIVSDEELFPLQKWYNQLIEKMISEITVADVLRMIRQKQFIDLALSRAMIFLQDDVFVGETYEGELLERIAGMDSSFITSYTDDLKKIIKNALEKCVTYEWSYDGEGDEFKAIVNALERKLDVR